MQSISLHNRGKHIPNPSLHANICWQIIACIVCKEINLWLRFGWCGLEYGLLLLIVVEVVAAQVACPSSPCSVPGYLPCSSWVAADPQSFSSWAWS
jgi:hypothetical protein